MDDIEEIYCVLGNDQILSTTSSKLSALWIAHEIVNASTHDERKPSRVVVVGFTLSDATYTEEVVA